MLEPEQSRYLRFLLLCIVKIRVGNALVTLFHMLLVGSYLITAFFLSQPFYRSLLFAWQHDSIVPL